MSNMETSDNRYIEFKLGDQLYALPLLSVKEVIPKPEVTAMPNSPPHFEGMINLRGQILGIFNIKKKLALKGKDQALSGEVVVVIEYADVNIGMIVDEVTRVLHASPDALKPAPLKEGDPARAFVSAVINSGEDLVLVVNVNELLELQKYKAQIGAA